MQAKKEAPPRGPRDTKRIVVEVSWDTRETGHEIPTLVGEWSDWEEKTAVAPEPSDAPRDGTSDRRGKAVLDLEEGVYAYKLRTSRGFFLNRAEPRTATTGFVTNNVLSVGGAAEPILHAAAAPFLHHPATGGMRVRAALRKGTSEGMAVVWSEGESAPARETAMSPSTVGSAASESHRYFEARLPVSTARVDYAFRLDGGAVLGRDDGAKFRAPAPRDGDVPAWWADAVVYTVFVDRFRASRDGDEWSVDPGPGKWAGGDLRGIRRSLDDLADLGVNTLYLTPIHVAGSCHRYDLEDPMRVDPALGGEEALDELLRAVHARGMRLLLDWSFCHAGARFAPYRDVVARGEASRFADWFQWADAERVDPGAPATRRVIHYAGCTTAPLLNLKNADLAGYALATAEHWMRRGVDGLRIDCAAQVPMDLLVELKARVRTVQPEAVIVGELLPAHGWRWSMTGALDASTDFGFYRLAVDRFGSPVGHTVDLAERWERLVAERGPEATHGALHFISTHDFPRFFSLTRAAGCEHNDALALTWLVTMPGVPMLLYGEEIGMRAEVAEIDPEGVWRDRAPFPWNASLSGRAAALRELVRELLRVRAGSTALRRGDVESMLTDGPLWVYRRRSEGDVVDVAIHQGEEPLVIELADDELPQVTVLCKVGRARLRESTVTFEGPGAVVLRRTAGASGRSLVTLHRARDEAFRLATGRAEYPRRLDVSLTERCNLKCAHCITLAPERTARGTARSMSPFILSRLRTALRHAEHVGFVHGGESLTSPLFFDFLHAVREARGDQPTMVHLLTNGMLLSRAMTERIVAAGVRSISVSLDGARPATNDVVRSGAVFDTIVHHLEDAVRVRKEHGLDLRLGLSTVVLPSNLEELGELVDLAADVGLDWVKFEELVPATPYARTSLLLLDDTRARTAVRAASIRARERGVLALDHTTPMPRWVCALEDGESRERQRGDEFVNRTALNPCRDAWELACIEPNGDVLLGAFHGVCAGNIADSQMIDVWNSDAAHEERRRARLARKCLGGDVVCTPPPDGHP